MCRSYHPIFSTVPSPTHSPHPDTERLRHPFGARLAISPRRKFLKVDVGIRGRWHGRHVCYFSVSSSVLSYFEVFLRQDLRGSVILRSTGFVTLLPSSCLEVTDFGFLTIDFFALPASREVLVEEEEGIVGKESKRVKAWIGPRARVMS